MSGESIIIDNGSNTCKAGFSDDDMPRVEIPTVYGSPSQEGGGTTDQLDTFVGEEAISKGGILDIKNPIIKGEFLDWEGMEKIWKHIFYNELMAETKSHPVIMSEAAFSKHENKREMAEVLFEKLNIESLYITNSSTLALYANGRTTGIVIDVGYETTSCVPIYEGFVLNHAIIKMDIGGNDLTQYLCNLITESDSSRTFTNAAQRNMINEMKEKICYVAEDYDSEMKKSLDSNKILEYKLPDKTSIIRYKTESFQCSEMLFQPSMNGKDMGGIHEQAIKSIKRCDDDIHKDLYLNVILCGGSTLFMKIKNRFNKELQSLAPTGKIVKVIAPPERKYSAWLGGAILASLDSFKQQMFCTKKEYLDGEKDHVNNKFF